MFVFFLYLCYFILFAAFLTGVQLRIELISNLLIYSLIIYPGIMPFVFIILDQRKKGQTKARDLPQKNKSAQ